MKLKSGRKFKRKEKLKQLYYEQGKGERSKREEDIEKSEKLYKEYLNSEDKKDEWTEIKECEKEISDKRDMIMQYQGQIKELESKLEGFPLKKIAHIVYVYRYNNGHMMSYDNLKSFISLFEGNVGSFFREMGWKYDSEKDDRVQICDKLGHVSSKGLCMRCGRRK